MIFTRTSLPFSRPEKFYDFFEKIAKHFFKNLVYYITP